MTIKRRLLVAFVVLSVVLATSVVYVLASRRHMNERTDALRQEVTEPLRLAHRLQDLAYWEMVSLVGSVRTRADGGIRTGDAASRAQIIESFPEQDRELVEAIAALEEAPLPAAQRTQLASYKQATSAIQGGLQAEIGVALPVIIEGEAAATYAEMVPLLWQRSEDSRALTEHLVEVQAQGLAELEQQYDTTRRNASVALATAFAAAALASVLIAAAIVRPVRRTADALGVIADGDLTPRLEPRTDELGQVNDALNRTLEQVGSVIEVIDQSATELASYSASFSERGAEVAMAATMVADDAGAATGGIETVRRGVHEALSVVSSIDRAAEAFADRVADATARVERALAQARSARQALGTVPPGSSLQPAADALDDLVEALERLQGVELRVDASADQHRMIAGDVASQLEGVTTAGGTVESRLDAVTAAVSFTRQFIDTAKADADALAELSQTLELFTSVFKYRDEAPAPLAPPPHPGTGPGTPSADATSPVSGVEEVHS